MALQVAQRGNGEQGVQHAAVSHIDLRRLDQPFADVDEVRRQAANHHRVDQQIEIAVRRGVRSAAERQAELRCVEKLPLQVGEHPPEALQGFGGHANAHLGQVALQERADEVLTPPVRRCLVRRKEARGKAAAQPELLQAGEVDIAQFRREQRRQLEIGNPSGERLARLPQQVARGRAQEQEPPRPAVGIDFGAQGGKKTGRQLHFVEHEHAIPLRSEEELGLLQRGPIGRALEIEQQRPRIAGSDRPGKCRLADLTRPEQHERRNLPQTLLDEAPESTIYHPCILHMTCSICKVF